MAVTISGGNGESLDWVANLDIDPFRKAEAELTRIMEANSKKLSDSVAAQSQQLEDLAKKASTALAAYTSFTAGANFIKDIVEVRGQFQLLETSFRTMLGSKEKADKLMAEAVTLAAQTPFTLQQVGSGAKQLLAYGFAANDIVNTLTRLGNVSSGVGSELNDIVYLYGTLKASGRATQIDLQQFAGRGIPIYAELGRVLGVATEEVRKMATEGKIGFPEVEKAFNNMTNAGGMFFNLMQEQSKTLTGLISNLKDAWSRMENEIGKSNEGLFANAIKGATSLIDNYKEVLKVLEVIALTYGSYRAAIIATNVVTTVATELSVGFTAAEILRARAVTISNVAMKLLNSTMLSNPAVLVTTGILTLVSAIAIFSKEAVKAKSSADLLAGSQKSIGDSLADQEGKIKVYAETLKKGNVSEKERLDIYGKLKDISPDLVKGLNAQSISYDALTKNLKGYLDQLRNRLTLESNSAAVTESIKRENLIQDQIEKTAQGIRDIQDLQKANPGNISLYHTLPGDIKYLKELNDQLDKQKKTTEEIAKKGVAKVVTETAAPPAATKRTPDVINAEIDAIKKKQSAESESSDQYIKYQKQINALEAEALAITGQTKKQQEAVENKALSLLEKRKNVLEEIHALERGADQSGLLKEQSEIDKVNEKYDIALTKITDINKKVDLFNSKNPGKKLQGFGLIEVNALNAARAQEVSNTQMKVDADAYKKSLDDKQALFEKYETAKKDVGLQRATEMYEGQTHDFENYANYLRAEAAKLIPKVLAGTATIADSQNLIEIGKRQVDVSRKQDQQILDSHTSSLKEALDATKDYNTKKLEINAAYDKKAQLIQKATSGDEQQDRLKINQADRKADLDDLEKSMGKYAGVYKKINEDITALTAKQIKDEIVQLKSLLSDKNLPLDLVNKIKGHVKELENTLSPEMEALVKNFGKISSLAGSIGQDFNAIADSVQGLNSKLADTLRNMAGFATIISQGAQAAGQLATPGQEAAGVASAIGSVTGFISLVVKAKASQAQTQAAVLSFNDQLILGEVTINELYRERERSQAKINDSKLAGINAENEALKKQKSQVQKDYQTVLDQIAKESYVVSEKSKSTNLFNGILGATPLGGIANLFGIGRGSAVDQQLASLAGKSFEDLEKLFNSGQLTDKAKTLFQELQKLKQEGIDIDAELERNKNAIDQLFTGTTADSIAQSIADGFKSGLRSAQDFANNLQDMLQTAFVNSLKAQYLDEQIKGFYADFAKASESGGVLTADEVKLLTAEYNDIIKSFGDKFKDLQQISGLSFTAAGAGGTGNALVGGIKAIQENTAELIAGQFGGLRITAGDQLAMATRHLTELQAISANTSYIPSVDATLKRLETMGIKVR